MNEKYIGPALKDLLDNAACCECSSTMFPALYVLPNEWLRLKCMQCSRTYSADDFEFETVFERWNQRDPKATPVSKSKKIEAHLNAIRDIINT